MNVPRFLGIGLCVSAMLLGNALAQNATTVPVGAITIDFPATTVTTSKVISIPLHNPPVFSGAITSVGNDTITVSANFTANQFTGPGNPHFLRITKGNQEGRTMLILSNTQNQISVDITDRNPISGAAPLNISELPVVVGDTIQIVPGDTLSSLFGDNTPSNPLIFSGGTGVLNADTIGISSKTSPKIVSYFFSTTLGHWKSLTSNASANDLTLYPEDAIIVTRRAGRPAKTLTLTGEVPATNQLTRIVGTNAGMWTSTKLPIALTLSQLNINGWQKSNSFLSADTIGFYNPNSPKYDVYYQRADNSWRKVGDNSTDYSNLEISPATGFYILRRGTTSGPSSFLTYNLTYTVSNN